MKQEEKIEALNALRRMRNKVENLRLEFKALGNPRKRDMEEMKRLLDVIYKRVGDV